MLKITSFLLILIVPVLGHAQFGINAEYLFGQSETLDLQNISQDGIQVSLEYGFRLKEKRLEFHPGIGYRTTWAQDQFDGQLSGVDLDLNTSIYPFDFGGDCDCPTFSKEGHLVKKGFFIEVSPGLSYQTLQRDNYMSDPGAPIPLSSSNLVFKLGLGAGLDIGLTEQWTLTPLFAWNRVFPEEWEGLGTYGETAILDDQDYLSAGLRLTYKPDSRHRRR